MKKFENVDVIEALRKIMLHNTQFYQSDYKYDIQTLTDAASVHGGGIRSFLWMSRKSGTWCFPERNVFIDKTYAHNTWLYHRGDPDIKAFWVDVAPIKDGQVHGDIYEIDYAEHVLDVAANSIMPSTVELMFRNPNSIHTFDYDEYDKNLSSIRSYYGTLSETKYIVPSEYQLFDTVFRSKNACLEDTQPANIDDYVRDMVREHFHSRGYTADDMTYVIPNDIYDAIKYDIPAYALYPGNRIQQITTKKEAQNFVGDNVLLGIKHDDKKLLNYLVQHSSSESELFSKSELEYIYKTALSMGISNLEDISDSKMIESIVYKLGKVLDSPDMEYENKQMRDQDMVTER